MVDANTFVSGFVEASKSAPINSVGILVQSWIGYISTVVGFGIPALLYLGAVTLIVNHFIIGNYVPGNISYAVSFAVAVFTVPILAPFVLPVILNYFGSGV